MKSFLNKQWVFLVVLLLFASGAQAAGLPDFTELVKNSSPAVVNISTIQKVTQRGPRLPHGLHQFPEGSPFEDFFRRFFGEGEGEPRSFETHSLGSGFILSSDGYVITNYHVIRDADEIIVRLSDRSELEAEVVGGDERSDLALLKVKAKGLPTLKQGDSSQLKVGEWVLAIGSPFGFEHSATAGIVSAVGRSLPSENYVPFIQTDVAINPGNSGGPLFNLAGEVVGINSQIYSRTGGFMGVSFAIPIDVAMEVVEQLKEKGQVSRGWLGVVIQDVTRELAESFGLKRPRGALVARVLAGSPAAKGGIQAGDIITRFDGNPVPRSSDLPPLVGRTEIGQRVDVQVLRAGVQKTLKVKIGELPEEEELREAVGEPGQTFEKRLAIEVAELSEEERAQLDLTSGVQITNVEEGPASEAGLRRGDIILSINNTEVKDITQFKELVGELPAGKSVPLLLQRGQTTSFVAIKIPEGG
ncbi:DegQ family serine endoprotease [Nitrosococcus wardiae]|uniref:Probable periplasmic serine endoprotease DegP-like n=1 Tax=Nitrosococcus wardiae TaxID=1814290 RepID=A0A4P7BTI8_9GAMM|nr:DegQ family serine endoprotease [Nitrosococcus wardiae]QBQ53181.1 DegQ family serine endoprotease [Nitrosococcus wardiae]